jgi:L-phenylalanine/L-methionine N-acetyltransferase
MPMPLTIRRARPGDAATMTQMMSDPAVYPGTLQLPYPSESRWHKILEDNETPGNTNLVLVAESAGAVVGIAGLHPIGPNLRRRHAMSLGITVSGPAQGQGVGTALMSALMHYADHWGHVLRVELTVFADNAAAIALYRRHGFVQEGRHHAYALRGGQYADVLSMARLHPHPPKLPVIGE